jgi:malonyl-ACP decarboxylase
MDKGIASNEPVVRMGKSELSPVAITGMGVVCSIAHTIPEFTQAIREGRHGITNLPVDKNHSVRIGALIKDFAWQDWVNSLKSSEPSFYTRVRKVLKNTTESTRLSAYAATQAVRDAHLGEQEDAADEVGLIVAGSNLAQDYIMQNWVRFRETGRPNPRYALSFLDSNQVGCLSEIFSIRGPGFTIGAAAASGNAALFQAFHWIRSGIVRRCLVVGACIEFTALDLEAFAILGAACSGRWQDDPARACRPFDQAHEGFVWGQGAGCVVLESPDAVNGRRVLGELVGASLLLDGNHLSDPRQKGEIRAMQLALNSGDLNPGCIGYINAHGTSAPLGDRTECAAIKSLFRDHLSRVWINSTKSLTGHCFSASGVIELIACVVQLNNGFIHPNRNLDSPIDRELKLVSQKAEPLDAEYALSNGFGFGGINSSVVVRKGTSS